MGYLVHTLARKANSTLFAFITRDSDSAVYNSSTGLFVQDVKLHLTRDSLTRDQFRVYYAQTRSGSYTLEVDCGEFLDGSYTLETRYIVDGQESPPTDVVSLDIQAGEVRDDALNISISSAPNLNLFCYIRDTFTGKYLRSDIATFASLSLIDEAENIRSEFRHSLNELSPGRYLLNRSLASVPDTVLDVTLYQLSNGLEYKAGLPVTVHVHDGRQQRGVLFNTVLVNHDILGNDNLRYLGQNGEPIEGAEVYLFRKADYNSDTFDGALGRTVTREDGRWMQAIPAQAGDTYTVVLFKPGVCGPDSVDIAI